MSSIPVFTSPTRAPTPAAIWPPTCRVVGGQPGGQQAGERERRVDADMMDLGGGEDGGMPSCRPIMSRSMGGIDQGLDSQDRRRMAGAGTVANS